MANIHLLYHLKVLKKRRYINPQPYNIIFLDNKDRIDMLEEENDDLKINVLKKMRRDILNKNLEFKLDRLMNSRIIVRFVFVEKNFENIVKERWDASNRIDHAINKITDYFPELLKQDNKGRYIYQRPLGRIRNLSRSKAKGWKHDNYGGKYQEIDFDNEHKFSIFIYPIKGKNVKVTPTIFNKDFLKGEIASEFAEEATDPSEKKFYEKIYRESPGWSQLDNVPKEDEKEEKSKEKKEEKEEEKEEEEEEEEEEKEQDIPKVEEITQTPKVEEITQTPKVEEITQTPKVEEITQTPKVEEKQKPPEKKD